MVVRDLNGQTIKFTLNSTVFTVYNFANSLVTNCLDCKCLLQHVKTHENIFKEYYRTQIFENEILQVRRVLKSFNFQTFTHGLLVTGGTLASPRPLNMFNVLNQ